MVRNRKRTSSQQTWSSENMLKAIKAVQKGMAWNTASKNFSVPRATLQRRVLDKNKDAVSNKKILGAKRPVFSHAQEEELVDYILKMEQTFFGLTTKDMRYMAFSLAEKNQINHPFNKQLGLVGEDWLSGFRKRHPEITLRKPEATSAARAQGFNKPNVEKFFNLLKTVMDKHHFPPHRVYNVDETGVTTVQTKSLRVLAQKGRRQVGTITSAERGQLSTAVICMSAGGNYVPPMIIFPRQRMKQELTDGAPPGSIFSCSKSGWMQLEIFSSWFDHYINHTKPTPDDPILLILDGHMTHTKNLAVIEKARQNNVTILCLPPHCSHKMQPLDRSFMFPLNTFYVASVENFLRNNPGRTVTQFQISRLFGEAYLKSATSTTAVNGFRKCGIYPYNPGVFSDVDFMPSEVTDQPLIEMLAESTEIEDQPSSSYTITCLQSEFPQRNSSGNNNTFKPTSPQPSTSGTCSTLKPTSPQPSTSGTCSTSNVPFIVSPKDIKPFPKSTRIRSQKRKRGTGAVLMDSPYKNKLEKEKAEKEEVEKRRQTKENRKREKEHACRNVFHQIELKASTCKKKTKGKRKTNKVVENYSSSDDDENTDTECLFCGDTYLRSKSGEGWVRCIRCLQWAHEACAGIEENEDDYTCDNCFCQQDGALQSGDELVTVNSQPVKTKTKVEIAKMIQAAKDEVVTNYNKSNAEPREGKSLYIALKTVKHLLMENMLR